MADYSNLGEFLKNQRIKAKLTQSALADIVGDIHPQFVSNWERGQCAPPAHSFDKVIEVLKISRKKLVEVMLQDERERLQQRFLKREVSA